MQWVIYYQEGLFQTLLFIRLSEGNSFSGDQQAHVERGQSSWNILHLGFCFCNFMFAFLGSTCHSLYWFLWVLVFCRFFGDFLLLWVFMGFYGFFIGVGWVLVIYGPTSHLAWFTGYCSFTFLLRLVVMKGSCFFVEDAHNPPDDSSVDRMISHQHSHTVSKLGGIFFKDFSLNRVSCRVAEVIPFV